MTGTEPSWPLEVRLSSYTGKGTLRRYGVHVGQLHAEIHDLSLKKEQFPNRQTMFAAPGNVRSSLLAPIYDLVLQRSQALALRLQRSHKLGKGGIESGTMFDTSTMHESPQLAQRSLLQVCIQRLRPGVCLPHLVSAQDL